MYNVEIMELETIDLMGYTHQGDYMNIGQVFEKLFIYADSHGLLNEKTRSIGLYYGDPKSMPEEDLRSMACITTGPEGIPPECTGGSTNPGGTLCDLAIQRLLR